MCGILFAWSNGASIPLDRFRYALERQGWRGPDNMDVRGFDEGRVLLGHNRLAIIDLHATANQPMISRSGRWVIVFNGEIYNYRQLREQYGIETKTTSDTEVLLEGIEKFGVDFINRLEGMFAFVAYDTLEKSWIAARDGLGIKPLYYLSQEGLTIVASEPVAIGQLVGLSRDPESISEWKLIRRPMPGCSFFNGVQELLPGHVLRNNAVAEPFWRLSAGEVTYSQAALEQLLANIVVEHDIGDVGKVSLLSGGIDSAVIAALSSASVCYSIGQESNNEFSGASESADVLGKNLINVTVSEHDIRRAWRHLINIRKEPIGVPNEALIYLVCEATSKNEKIVLTGEGADELFFGYDKIFLWAINNPDFELDRFLELYAYSNEPLTPRLKNYIEALAQGKSSIEFVEDWFYLVHLPGLLRRMDCASMAASKEARVPFADRRLAQYMYRQLPSSKIGGGASKLPLREFARRLGLQGALQRKKIGFSAKLVESTDRHEEYRDFQSFVLGELEW
jgi:asparagine synthase (glutamine-hydrolysing)